MKLPSLPSSFTCSGLTLLSTISSLTANNGTITNNLTISGTLQSPLTSLLGVSINEIYTYARAAVGVSGSLYVTRNETTIPVSLANYILNDNQLFNSQANSNSFLQFGSNGVPTNAFFVGRIGVDMVLSTSGALILKKYGGVENSRIDTSANWIINNHLTVSGTLKSPLTSLLGVSIGVIDETMISTSMPQYLTRIETIIPSSFITSSLRKLGTSCVAGANPTVDVNLPNVVFQASNFPNDTNVVISSSDAKKISLYFGNPNDNGTNISCKTAIIVQGEAFGLGTMNFCFNRNTTGLSHVNSNTTINETLVSFKHDGSLYMTATLNLIGSENICSNLTVSGALQCSTNSLLGASTIWFGNTLNDKIVVYQDTAGNIGLGVTSWNLVIHTNDTATNISLGVNSNGASFTGYAEKFRMNNTTNINPNNSTI